MEESGDLMTGGQPLLVVTLDGPRLTDIPIKIVPMTYDQFQFPSLDLIFPARPINAATGYTYLCSYK